MKKSMELAGGITLEAVEYAHSNYQERLQSLLYMQSHWINNKGKLMDIADDFYLDFIKLLNKHKVEYLVIGGFAVNFHGYPRTTHDMDLWVKAEPRNSKKLLSAIDEFGFDVSILKGVYLKKKEPIKLPHDTITFKKVEILADISGVFDFEAAYKDRTNVFYDNVELSFIGYEDLLKNKLSSARAKDLDDVLVLKQVANARLSKATLADDENTLKRKGPKL